MKKIPHLPSSILVALLATSALHVQSQDPDGKEAEDLALFREAIQFLEKAKLSDVLDERRLLQDLDIEAIPETDQILDEARDRLKDLQEQGVIAPEAVSQVEAAVNGAPAATGGAAGVLGPAPEKAPRRAKEPLGEMITIENSRKFASSLDEGILVFEGDVLVTSEDEFTLRCDKLEVHLKEDRKEIKLAIATGRMVVINGSSDEGPVEARCQYAVYRENDLHLRIWPEVSMPGRLWKARDRDASIKLVVDKDGNIDPEASGDFEISLKKPEGGVAP